MHSTKTVFKTVPVQNGCSLLGNRRPETKLLKWDNSYVPPIVAASQSHARPTCTVLRIFLTLLPFFFFF